MHNVNTRNIGYKILQKSKKNIRNRQIYTDSLRPYKILC